MRNVNTFLKRIAFTAIVCGFSVLSFGQITEIATEAELRSYLEDKSESLDGHYKLTADITLTGTWKGSWRLGADGILDGDGHVIYGLNIPTAGRDGRGGFFVYLRGTVKNLGFENATISGATSDAGVIAGTVKGGKIENCYVKNSSVSGSNESIGGIVGYAEKGDFGGTIIKNCYVDNVVVTGGANRVGGIIGNIAHEDANPGSVTECYVINSSIRGNGNEIVGGIAGRVSGYNTIEKCYVQYSSIYGNSDVGGIAGRLHNNSIIKLSYSANTVVNGNNNVGGLAGRFWGINAVVENSYSTARVNSRSWQAGGLVGQATDGSSRISNSYFSGILSRYGDNRASGILGLMGTDDVTIENCANLSPLIVSNEKYRIVSFGTRPATVVGNYALETLNRSDFKGNDTENGEDVSVSDAKLQSFYENTLSWEFGNTWKMTNGYPVLKWQETINISFAKESLDSELEELIEGSSLDLSMYKSGNGLDLIFTTDNPKVEIDGTVAKLASGAVVSDLETAEIKVSVADNNIADGVILVTLVPNQLTIATAEEFIEKINAVSGANFKLTADIDFDGVDFDGINNFTGNLDGDGYALQNISLTSSSSPSGIFKRINGATIKNLIVDGAVVKGHNQAGILVGEMRNGSVIEQSAIINSTLSANDHKGIFAGNMGGSTIKNCYSTSSIISTTASWSGGIIGLTDRNAGENLVENCYNAGDVISQNNGAGGIIGRAETTSTNATIIRNSVNLTRTIEGDGDAGRIVGVNESNTVYDNNYSLSTTLVRGNQINDGAANNKQGANITDGDVNSQIQAFYEGLGWDFADVWTVDEGASYPTLQMQKSNKISLTNHTDLVLKEGEFLDLSFVYSSSGLDIDLTFSTTNSLVEVNGKEVVVVGDISGPQEVVFETSAGSFDANSFIITVLPEVFGISTIQDLDLINKYPAGTFELMNDLDMTGVTSAGLCSDAAPFTGIFDGKGYKVSGLNFDDNGTSNVGFFRRTKNATIKKLGLEEVNFKGGNNIGGIAGYADGGLIEQCYVANSTINASDRAAGIAAVVTGNVHIKDCYVAADIIARDQQSGGIAAASFGEVTIENVYFEGSVTGGRYKASMLGWVDADANATINNSLSLATTLSGGEPISRIVTASDGRTAYAILSNNYSISITDVRGNTVTTGTATNKDGANLVNDTDANSREFYEITLGWDFNNVWVFEQAMNYPTLKAFPHGPLVSVQLEKENQYSIRVMENMVNISGLSEKAMVSIFSINGQKLVSVEAAYQTAYSLPAKGVYFVAVEEDGNRTFVKVLNK